MRVGQMRIARLDEHNWTTQRYVAVEARAKGADGKLALTGETRHEWQVVGYYSNLRDACHSALNDGAGGSGAEEIIASLNQVYAELKACLKEVAS